MDATLVLISVFTAAFLLLLFGGAVQEFGWAKVLKELWEAALMATVLTIVVFTLYAAIMNLKG